MPRDPQDATTTTTVPMPPVSGPGSGKAAWMVLARTALDANRELVAVIERQREAIRERDAEIELLRRQIAERKPKGSRPRVRAAVVEQIERDIAAGKTDRPIAVAYGVSHVTVYRIRRRMLARERVAAAAD